LKQALSNHKGKPSMRFKILVEADAQHCCKREKERERERE